MALGVVEVARGRERCVAGEFDAVGDDLVAGLVRVDVFDGSSFRYSTSFSRISFTLRKLMRSFSS